MEPSPQIWYPGCVSIFNGYGIPSACQLPGGNWLPGLGFRETWQRAMGSGLRIMRVGWSEGECSEAAAVPMCTLLAC